MQIGAVISELRKKKKISQGKFAIQLGISQTYLSLIEKNKKKPSLDLFETISKNLEIPLYYLMFKSLDIEKDIKEEKRETYKNISPIINSMIEGFFIDENK